MDIDVRKQKQQSEGHCFRCDKKGHLSKDCLEKGATGTCSGGSSIIATLWGHQDLGSKRVGHWAPDSTAMTKDLHTGEPSSIGWSDTFISCTDILSITHLNIPPPHALGQVSTTSFPDQPPVLELMNRYSILPVEETNDSPSVETSLKGLNEPPARAQAKATSVAGHRAESPKEPITKDVGTPGSLAKCLASSSLWAKASNEKMTTISSPLLTATPQSRPSPSETTAVMQAWPEGGKWALNANFDKASSHDREVSAVSTLAEDAEESVRMPTNIPSQEDRSQGKIPWSTGARCDAGRPETLKATRDPLGPGVTDQAGKTVHSAQVESAVPARINSQDQDSTPAVHTSHSTMKGQNKDDTAAERKEAASAQAVKRGHQVIMIKVPDNEDDMSFQKWVAAGSPTISPRQRPTMLLTPPETPPTMNSPLPNEGVGSNNVRKTEVTSPTVAMSPATGAKVWEAPHQWMRPFEVDWMLRAICEAWNDNATRAALAIWIHKDKGAEMTDELLTELRLAGEPTQERLYKLCESPQVIHRLDSKKSNFLVEVILNPYPVDKGTPG